MTAMSVVQLVCVLVLACRLAAASSLLAGERHPGDEMVCGESVHLPAQPGSVIESNYTCRVTYRDQSLTYFHALDLGVRGRGGNATIADGGIGRPQVSIRMRSQPGQPLQFSINAYATPSDLATTTALPIRPWDEAREE